MYRFPGGIYINLKAWNEKSRWLRTETCALFLACKDPRVPWYAKIILATTVGYALSRDMIPDFVPVLGQLDDLIVVPIGISLVPKMMPKEVLDEYREKAKSEISCSKTKRWIGVAIIALIWLLIVYLFLRFVFNIF
jgi:uncharacterized membrane protein YkvA (DUF1232 family)